jgi:hypothetical protein
MILVLMMLQRIPDDVGLLFALQDCEVAWDQAEELLAHKSHKKVCAASIQQRWPLCLHDLEYACMVLSSAFAVYLISQVLFNQPASLARNPQESVIYSSTRPGLHTLILACTQLTPYAVLLLYPQVDDKANSDPLEQFCKGESCQLQRVQPGISRSLFPSPVLLPPVPCLLHVPDPAHLSSCIQL